MTLLHNEIISVEIDDILTEAGLGQEMLQLITSSFEAELKKKEPYKWAHLVLMNCECVSGKSEIALSGAIAMEFIALAADIFDDIQDQDNDEMPWRKIPTASAINLALCLLMLGYQSVARIKDRSLAIQICSIFNCMGIRASVGQYQEVLYGISEQIELDQYFELIRQKSGSLTAAACKIGGVMGRAPESIVLKLEEFGANYGIMNQISNDLNDFTNLSKKKDFLDNKKTLPYIYLQTVLQDKKARDFNELLKEKCKKKKYRNYLKRL